MICPVCKQDTLTLIFDPLPTELLGKFPCCCRDCIEKYRPQPKNKSAYIKGCDSFNPHYDVQLGKHFNSKEERNKHLLEKGMTSHGSDSPRESTKTRIICSKDQAQKAERGGKI